MTRKSSGEMTSRPVIEALVATIAGARTRAWKEATWKAFKFHSRLQGSPRAYLTLLRHFTFVPDAYVVGVQDHRLDFFEVEIYNPMTTAKLQAYAVLAINLAYYDIDFSVFVVNKYGHINEVDLLPHYRDWLKKRTAARATPKGTA